MRTSSGSGSSAVDPPPQDYHAAPERGDGWKLTFDDRESDASDLGKGFSIGCSVPGGSETTRPNNDSANNDSGITFRCDARLAN